MKNSTIESEGRAERRLLGRLPHHVDILYVSPEDPRPRAVLTFILRRTLPNQLGVQALYKLGNRSNEYRRRIPPAGLFLMHGRRGP